MNVITIEGKLGSGAPEIAKDIAKKLSFDYIDRIIMAEIAKKVNTPLAVSYTHLTLPTICSV